MDLRNSAHLGQEGVVCVCVCVKLTVGIKPDTCSVKMGPHAAPHVPAEAHDRFSLCYKEMFV